MKDILIIGAGPIGLYAWYCAQLLHLQGHIVEQTGQIGGQAQEFYADKNIYDLPCILKITGQQIVNQLRHQIRSTSVQSCTLLKQISNLKFQQDHSSVQVTFYQNHDEVMTVRYRTVLITSGVGAKSPVKLDFGGSYQNIFYGVTSSLLSRLRNKKIVVLGGGDSALDWANFLVEKQISSQVSIVHRRTFYRGKPASVTQLAINNIQQYKGFLIPADLNQHQGHNLTRLTLVNKINHQQVTISCDFIIVQYGFLTNISYIKDWPLKLNSQRKIVVNSQQETNLPGVFGAGDAVAYSGKYYNLTSGFGEVVNALFNITKVIRGSDYYPIYFGSDQDNL